MSISSTTSPRYTHPPNHTSRPSTSTPAIRPAPTPAPLTQNMPPLLSPNFARTPIQNVQASDARSPSPNYFGFHVADSSFPPDAAQHARQNWSPPSSTVRSTAAFSPTVVPVDQNPDFAAFRRQSEGKSFSLGSLHNPMSPTSRPGQNRTSSRQSMDFPKMSTDLKSMHPPSRPMQKFDSLDPDMANLGRSPKRHLSSDSSTFPDPPRKASPASFLPNDGSHSGQDADPHDRHPRVTMPTRKPPTFNLPKHRAETLPASVSSESSIMVTPQHVINLLDSSPEEILILDLRVSTQYARSRLSGALNLCIPTTLLKRPSFNVQKLAETFKDQESRSKFENWRSTKYIVVYDQAASQLKDAAICLNTVKKFDSEGYEGTSYIISGGFVEFAQKFPKYVDKGAGSLSSGSPEKLTLSLGGPDVAPVIGGCPLPAEKNAANPFFGNIRQNMDLIGGVGQITLKRPATMTESVEEDLPSWLKTASEEKDNGAKVSDKFLHIEKREQKRMQEALSGKVSYGASNPEAPKAVQIAGIEKGSKNRYNNIWPFEHTRVKLQDVPSHGCDYVNANHISSSLSYKKYIATQGPIPATFTDFWNVVWQQDVRVIVMLTAEKEGGQVKAHNYWSDKRLGPFTLQQLSERRASLEPAKINRHRRPTASRKQSTEPAPPLARIDSSAAVSTDQPFVTVRKLTLSHEGFPFERMREITQLQYSSWPDFGAPAHPAHLLGLVEQCDAVVRTTTGTKHSEPDPPNSRPVLVHCSAGCGRTGTFCTVDTVIDMLKRQRNARRTRQGTPMDVDPIEKQSQSPFFSSSSLTAGNTGNDEVNGDWLAKENQDLIEKVVEEFRHQRISMVQSLRQFVLCYESIMEWLTEQDHLENDT